MIEPRVSLVGAGPGDPELITVKGLKALASADVVLYDALVHPDLVNHAPTNALKIFVGKQKGVCQFPQEEINRLIVFYALSHGHVVRLKGGDPFIFGRGHEELLFAEKEGIAVTVIPGLSSALAVPALQGVPLTRRGINDGFFVITGTTREHQLSRDLQKAVASDATVVVLMGMHKAKEIQSVFELAGKSDLPVMIIQNGSMPEERVLLTSVHSMVKDIAQEAFSSPAIIVLGDVVNCHPQYRERLHALLHKTNA
jgi:uroporphyrin-III C-methyltransferase